MRTNLTLCDRFVLCVVTPTLLLLLFLLLMLVPSLNGLRQGSSKNVESLPNVGSV